MDKTIANLNRLTVPLPEVRAKIVQLMKEGQSTMPLGDFILLVQTIIRESKSQ